VFFLREMFEILAAARSHLDLNDDLEREKARMHEPQFNATRGLFGHVPAI
jgi:hypothetical protein